MSTSTTAISLEVLPASYGDCLLLTCPTASGVWTLLMDTGPDETYPALRRRLMALPLGEDGRRYIDLLVVSHIDHDHIGSARKMLDDAELALSFGDVWFNAPPGPRPKGAVEGEALAQILGAVRKDLPWNRAWRGRHVVTPAIGGGVQMGGLDLPTITLLSPTPDRLEILWREWAKELARLRSGKTSVSMSSTRGGPRLPDQTLPMDLGAQARAKTPVDTSAPNGSSIAFLLEHKGASVLLGADAVLPVMEPALKALAARRGLDRLTVDAVKLSHHASRGNVSNALLELLDCPNFIVSTDNKMFNHPDDEALARVISARAGKPLTLWFNHDTPRNQRWNAPALREANDYAVRFPESPEAGVRLMLQAAPPMKSQAHPA